MVLHGYLVLDAHSGALLFSERFSTAFGLASCEQLGEPRLPHSSQASCICEGIQLCTPPSPVTGHDDMRLGTMLFALHLNASSVHEHSGGLAAMKHCIGNVVLCYLRSQSRALLLVASVEAGLASECADYLSAALLARFERRFSAQLDARSDAGGRCTLRRRSFSSDLVHVVASLASWIVQRAEADYGTASACGSARARKQQPGASPSAEPRAGCSPACDRGHLDGCTLLAVLHDATCQALRQPSASAANGVRVPLPEPIGGACGCFPSLWARHRYAGSKAPRSHSARRPAPHSRRVAVEGEEVAPLVATSAGQAQRATGTMDANAGSLPPPLAAPPVTDLLWRTVQAAANPLHCQRFSNSIFVPEALAGAVPPSSLKGGGRAACDERRLQAIVLVRPPLLLCVQLNGKALTDAEAPQAAAEAAEVMDRWVTSLRITMVFSAALLRRVDQQALPSAVAIATGGWSTS
jgi:hypothetical protein